MVFEKKSEKKIGILDPEGNEKNPLTGKKGYSDTYKNWAMIWSNFPVYTRGPAERLIEEIKRNRVMVLESGTGSGKTVLIPKFAMHATDYKGKVIVTTPKQLTTGEAARFAAMLLDVNIGEQVGFQYRGAKLSLEEAEITGDYKPNGPDTKLLFSTDGSLVSMMSKDPKLKDISTVIIDEAHERGIGIDEALLYMRRALRANRNLKLIIMSATLPNADLFLNYYEEFDPHHEELPSEPNKPVEIIYSKKDYKNPKELNEESIRILFQEIIAKGKEGDILIFVSGGGNASTIEREINNRDPNIFTVILTKDTSDENKKLATAEKAYHDYEKDRPMGGWIRRVVIATNVAESSVTIDGLTFVIDSGTEISSDYDGMKQMSILNTQQITRAQADQRKGRVGRTTPGVCYRLFTKEAFKKMKKSPKVSILSADMTTNFLKYLASPKITNLIQLVQFIGDLIEVPSNANILNSIRNLVTLSLITTFLREGKMTDEGILVERIMTEGKIKSVNTAKAVMASRYYRAERQVIILAAIINEAEKGISDFFSEPRNKKDKQRMKEYQDTLLEYIHPYGDIFSVYRVFLKYSDVDNRQAKPDLDKWCRNNYVNGNKMRKIKENSKNIYNKINRILDNIEQLDSEYKFKNDDEAALFSLFKGYFPNLTIKKEGKMYRNMYPENQTTASFSVRGESFFSLLSEKSLPKYMFYVKNFSMDRKTTFLICNACPKEFLDILKPVERESLGL